MNLKVSDIVTILSAVVALASTLTAPVLETVFPSHGTYLAGVLTVAALVAGVIIRTLTNKAGAPAGSVVQDANVVSAGTAVVHASTPSVGTNVTTTSTEPISAPQKGPV